MCATFKGIQRQLLKKEKKEKHEQTDMLLEGYKKSSVTGWTQPEQLVR